jgi:hypothetical protein
MTDNGLRLTGNWLQCKRPGRREAYLLVFSRHLGMYMWCKEIGLYGMAGALAHTHSSHASPCGIAILVLTGRAHTNLT